MGCVQAAPLPDGDKYVGSVRMGKRHGDGVYTWANGDVYNGAYLNARVSVWSCCTVD